MKVSNWTVNRGYVDKISLVDYDIDNIVLHFTFPNLDSELFWKIITTIKLHNSDSVPLVPPGQVVKCGHKECAAWTCKLKCVFSDLGYELFWRVMITNTGACSSHAINTTVDPVTLSNRLL